MSESFWVGSDINLLIGEGLPSTYCIPILVLMNDKPTREEISPITLTSLSYANLSGVFWLGLRIPPNLHGFARKQYRYNTILVDHGPSGDLEPLFERFTELYAPSNDEQGEPLVELINNEWLIFDDDVVLPGQHHDLLQEIVKGGQSGKELLYVPRVTDLWTDKA